MSESLGQFAAVRSPQTVRNNNRRYKILAGASALGVILTACSSPSDEEIGANSAARISADSARNSASASASRAAASAEASISSAAASVSSAAASLSSAEASRSAAETSRLAAESSAAASAARTSATPAPTPSSAPQENQTLFPDCSLEPSACAADDGLKIFNAPFEGYVLNGVNPGTADDGIRYPHGNQNQSITVDCRGTGNFADWVIVQTSPDWAEPNNGTANPNDGYARAAVFGQAAIAACAPGRDGTGNFK